MKPSTVLRRAGQTTPTKYPLTLQELERFLSSHKDYPFEPMEGSQCPIGVCLREKGIALHPTSTHLAKDDGPLRMTKVMPHPRWAEAFIRAFDRTHSADCGLRAAKKAARAAREGAGK